MSVQPEPPSASQPLTSAEPAETPTERRPSPSDGSISGAREWFAENGLRRPRQGKMLGGVCAALAHRYGVNVLVMRLLFIAAAIIGVPILIYVALWILIPRES
jgi:phage shock protein PspC (stress-responsive transcriptional regulator)